MLSFNAFSSNREYDVPLAKPLIISTMAQAASGMRAVRVYLEMIKFEHSIFALPFAMIGMMWGSLAVSASAKGF